MNEASNGDGGSREFFEFVAVPAVPTDRCGTIDIRNWIFDDNNGDFSGGPSSSEGIASGHARFANVPSWSAIPYGALILLYNPLDKNTNITLPDDPYDANNDSIYVIPLDNPDLEFCVPTSGSTVPNTSSASYSCNQYLDYLSSSGTRRWDCIQMRNGGDAVQTRDAGGVFFHGFSYGSGGGLGTGGPDGIHIGTSSGSGDNFYFDNNSSNDFSGSVNFVRGTAGTTDETPGDFNSLNNENWIRSIRCVPTPLPVSLLHFGAQASGEGIDLKWQTGWEIQNDHFVIERAGIDGDFRAIATISGKANNSQENTDYQYIDRLPYEGRVWYRLRQVDLNGEESVSHPVGVLGIETGAEGFEPWPNPAVSEMHFAFPAETKGNLCQVQIFDLQGNLVISETRESIGSYEELTVNVEKLPYGLYIYKMSRTGVQWMQSGRFLKK